MLNIFEVVFLGLIFFFLMSCAGSLSQIAKYLEDKDSSLESKMCMDGEEISPDE